MGRHVPRSALSTTPLCELKPGQKGCICDLSEANPAVCRRLMELGVEEGTRVQVMHAGLLGGPLTLEANGQLIGIRRSEARRIGVNAV